MSEAFQVSVCVLYGGGSGASLVVVTTSEKDMNCLVNFTEKDVNQDICQAGCGVTVIYMAHNFIFFICFSPHTWLAQQ